uniref:Late blight resistance protein n=1 Tax=Solanum tuberosum TaxID=4113 RepID=M1C3F8_SOLTU
MDVGKGPRHPNELILKLKAMKMSPLECKEAHQQTLNCSLDQRCTGCRLWSAHWINDALDADPSYLCQHHMMLANWHQYIECTSMRVGMLKQHRHKKDSERNTYLGSSQLKNT